MSTITQFPSGNTQYRIEFDYLARTFVVVTLVNSTNPALNRVLEVGRDYRFLNPTMIEMLVDQSGFDIVRINRQTGTELVVDFRNGSVLTASDLTNAELQAIHIAEEGRDQTVDLAKEYADAAGSSAGNAKDSEDEVRRIAASIRAAAIGYITRRSFEKGFNVTTWNEVLLWEEDGEYYRWDGTLPKNVPASSTPEASGGVGIGAWVSVGDAALRGNLKSEADGLGDSLLTAKQPFTGSVARTQHDKNAELLSFSDFASQQDAINAVIASSTIYFNNSASFILTVGASGQFATINAAIEAAQRMKPRFKKGNTQCIISLKAGFVMQEQVLLDGGTDLGWIRITAEDATVTIDETYITAALSIRDSIYPAFGAKNNCVLPTIGCQFKYIDNSTAKDGVAVILGSKVGFLPGTGVTRARNGLKVLYSSEAYCYMEGLTIGGDGTAAGLTKGCDFSYAANRGMHVAYNSRAGFARSNFSHSGGDYGVYVIWGSYADCYQSDASHAAGTAFIARDRSGLNCRQSNGSYSKRGFHALHNGYINARSSFEDGQTTNPWVGDGAKGCSEYGLLASNNSMIEANALNCDECTGSAGVSCADASIVNFLEGTAKNCTTRGIWAQRGSIVNASLSDVSGSPNGIVAESASQVAANSSKANTCSQFGLLAYAGSNISAVDLVATGCARGVEARAGSSITAANANLSWATDRAVSAIDGGRINCSGSNCQNAGSRGITARDGAHVAAVYCNVSGAGNWGVEVQRGSIVAFNNGIYTTGLSQSANTITANGIIFQ